MNNDSQEMVDMLDTAIEQRLVNYNHLTYLLYLVSFFTAGLMWIVPIIMNYYKQKDAKGSWLASLVGRFELFGTVL